MPPVEPKATHTWLEAGRGRLPETNPIWFEFCGNDVVLLSQTNVLAAARLLGDPSMKDAALLQVEPQYAPLAGDMTGSIPVGIETRNNTETPYWSTMNCHNHKEVWIHPAARWLPVMEDLVGVKP